MRYKADHKAESRAKLLDAAGRAFRRQGFGGIGVDGLAKEAGMTSGAFYTHFKSKDLAFEEVVDQGLDALHDAILAARADYGALWLDRFIDQYLGERLRGPMDQSCPLQSLSADVMRAPESTRTGYEEALLRITRVLADGLDPSLSETQRLGRASTLLALLSGGATMARAMASPEARWVLVQGLKRGAAAVVGG